MDIAYFCTTLHTFAQLCILLHIRFYLRNQLKPVIITNNCPVQFFCDHANL